MIWYEELQRDLEHWRKADWLEDAIIRAGLAHVISWAQVDRMLQALTENPWDFSAWITVDELLGGIDPASEKQPFKPGHMPSGKETIELLDSLER